MNTFYSYLTLDASYFAWREKMSDIFTSLATDAPNKDTGICGNLEGLRLPYYLRNLTWQLMPLWPEYTGSLSHPVPDPNIEGRYAAYVIFRHTENKWTGEYGNSRKCLCLWLAKQFANARIKKPHWTIAAFNNLILGE